jgi:thioredoxin-related protein
MRSILLVTLLAFFAQGVLSAPQARRDVDGHFFQAGFGDLPEELQLAAAEGKHGLFLMFGAEDCPPCKQMKERVLSLVAVQDYYRAHFRVLYVDFNGDVGMTDPDGRPMRAKDYAREVARVIGTPTFVFLDGDGREVLRHAGTTRDADEFMLLARFVVSGAYRSGHFADYRQRQSAAPAATAR